MDHLIWPKQKAIDFKSYTEEDWISIVRYVQGQFVRFMEAPVYFESLTSASIGDGFCLDMKSCPFASNAIGLTWQGVLGCVPLREAGYLYVCASLFLYAAGQKVIEKDGASYLEAVFVRREIGGGAWCLKGWKEDTYGEFGYFDEYRSCTN